MALKKKQINNTNHSRSSKLINTNDYRVEDSDLYVCVYDVVNKRKSLLSALKNSLVSQEEFEILQSSRTAKYHYIQEMKKELEKINSLYAKLQKLFPNTRHILTFAEKEMKELEHQVGNLVKSREIEDLELENLDHLKEELEEIEEEKVHQRNQKILKTNLDYNPSELEEEKLSSLYSSKHPQNKESKLNRIQNNLSIIEEKLKNL
ncbi:MAG: hypothetical protein LAT82_01730 [Nanoarchaeota archaeon]|nr:hypothetical protein [Nanoarchaeota archaeon]